MQKRAICNYSFNRILMQLLIKQLCYKDVETYQISSQGFVKIVERIYEIERQY